MLAPRSTLRFRSVFISDVHLGFNGCRAEFLLDFLRRVECQQIYLVGDIIDLWSLMRGFYWPQAHNDVIRTLLGKAKHGTRELDPSACRAHALEHSWAASTRQFLRALAPMHDATADPAPSGSAIEPTT